MNDLRTDGGEAQRPKLAATSLKAAMRRARVENAERGEAVDELRRTELLRLEELNDAIRPVLDEAPAGVDLFDPGIAHGERPRLFLDAIAFVDLGHDRRTYRFFQDTSYGRVLIAETANIDRVVAALTNYVARRLVERERALAADALARPVRTAANPVAAPTRREAEPAPPPELARPWAAIAADLFRFLLMTIGAVALIGLVAIGGFQAWQSFGRALWSAEFGAPPP